MKRRLLIGLALAVTMGVKAQTTNQTTAFRDFQPAIVHLTDGRTLTLPKANVFLKNSSLLYMRGNQTVQASMDNVAEVDFADRHYVKIDTLLAYVVDSVGQNCIYQASLIDMEAFRRQLENNSMITNLTLGEFVNITRLDLYSDNGLTLPVVHRFFFLYNGQIIRVHERTLWRATPKEKRRMFKTIIGQPSFSWTDVKSLKTLLEHM